MILRVRETLGSAEAAQQTAERFPLIDRLASYLSLAPAEIEFLRELHGLKKKFTRHRDIIAQGRPYRNVLILCSGLVSHYKILPDGKRQVLNLLLPGDLIGFPACFFENAVNAASSLTEVIVATLPIPTSKNYLRNSRAWPSRSTGSPLARWRYQTSASSTRAPLCA